MTPHQATWDPVAYANMVCGDQDQRHTLGSDQHAACVEFVAKNPPRVLLAIGGGTLEPVTVAPDSYENRRPKQALRFAGGLELV